MRRGAYSSVAIRAVLLVASNTLIVILISISSLAGCAAVAYSCGSV